MSEQITPDYPNEILDIVERKSYEWFKKLKPGDKFYLYSPTFRGNSRLFDYPFKFRYVEIVYVKQLNDWEENTAKFNGSQLLIVYQADSLRTFRFSIDEDPNKIDFDGELPYYYVSEYLI